MVDGLLAAVGITHAGAGLPRHAGHRAADGLRGARPGSTSGSPCCSSWPACRASRTSSTRPPQLDGASWWQVQRRIAIPLLGPTIRTWAFLSMIGSLQLFDMVWILTGGGPANATTTMATYLINQGTQRHNYGIAGAASVMLFVVGFVMALAYQVLDPATRHPGRAMRRARMTARRGRSADGEQSARLRSGPRRRGAHARPGAVRRPRRLPQQRAARPRPGRAAATRGSSPTTPTCVTDPDFWRYAVNSTVIALITTVIAVLSGVMAAYPLARYRVPLPRAALHGLRPRPAVPGRPSRSSRCSSWSPATCTWATPGGAWPCRRPRSRCR